MRVAVHIHVFYADIIPQLGRCFGNIISVVGENNVTTVVTYPHDKEVVVLPTLKRIFNSAHFMALPNVGYDIGPFFEFLQLVDWNNCDYIVKLHTKRDIGRCWINFRPLIGNEWRDLLVSFCSTEQSFRCALDAFYRQPRLGMIASERLIDPSGVGSCRHPEFSEALLRKLGLEPHGRTIVYGTMFIVRAHLMKPFRFLRIGDCDRIDPVDNHRITGLASAAEGAFPMAVETQGFYVSDGHRCPAVVFLRHKILKYLYTLIRFLSDFVRKRIFRQVID